MELREQIQELPKAEFDSLVLWVLGPETDRRESERARLQAQTQVIIELSEAGKLTGAKYVTLEDAINGAKVPPWQNPKGDITKAYPPGAVVKRKRGVYQSVTDGVMNETEPGTEGSPWREVSSLLIDPVSDPSVGEDLPEIVGESELGL